MRRTVVVPVAVMLISSLNIGNLFSLEVPAIAPMIGISFIPHRLKVLVKEIIISAVINDVVVIEQWYPSRPLHIQS